MGNNLSNRRRGVVIALVLLLAFFAASCSSKPIPVTAGASATPSPNGVPTALQNDMSPWPLLERLGQWNGSTFVPVTANSIRGGQVIALAHGWSPGFADDYNNLQSNSSSLVTFWNAQLVDPQTNQPLATNFFTLASALQAAAPNATIVMYSWIDQSATTNNIFQAEQGERATEINGHRMAAALEQMLSTNFVANGGQLHLIGHSFGANVATTAALSLAIQPKQLTLFDSPENNLARFGGAANNLQYKLTRLPLGRGANEIFVDNYISEVGVSYGDDPGLASVVNTKLAPPKKDNGGQRHQFPILWYAQSAQSPSGQVGYWWSPMAGGNPQAIGASYEQTDPTLPLQLEQTSPPPVTNEADLVGYSANELVIVGERTSATTNQVSLSGAQTTTASMQFTSTDNSLWLTFDAQLQTSTNDSLLLFIDGRLRWIEQGTGQTSSTGDFVILYDVAPGTHTLSAVVTNGNTTGAAAAATSASLTNLQIVNATDIKRNPETANSRNVIERLIVAVGVILLLMLLTVLLRFGQLLWRRFR